MKNSKIEWCDHTFNPWEGCTKVSPGCEHCYAEARNARYAGSKAPNWGKGASRRRTSASNWAQPLKWNREQDILLNDHIINQRPRVFCASLADWLDDEVPIEWLADLLELIASTPQLDWLLLTKRPEKWRDRIAAACISAAMGPQHEAAALCHLWLEGIPPANVWIGTTVEDQTRADERIPELLKIPARVRFLSCEPLLGKVNIFAPSVNWFPSERKVRFGSDPIGVHWLICGGESGREARPMDPDWARDLRTQCEFAVVAFLFKQWGEWRPFMAEDGPPRESRFDIDERFGVIRVGKKSAGRLLDGVEYNGFPEARA